MRLFRSGEDFTGNHVNIQNFTARAKVPSISAVILGIKLIHTDILVV